MNSTSHTGFKKILIVDDHPIVRAGLKQIIEEAPDLVVSDMCSNCRELLEKISENDYDIVILDITLQDGSGLDALKQIKQTKPELPVLILSMHPENQYALRTMKAGAAGYITKKSAEDELLSAVRIICSGRKYISTYLAEKFIDKLSGKTPILPHENLSDREYQVLFMVAQGRTVGQIAQQLHLSPKTVSTHRIHAMKKMKMVCDAEIVRYFIENKIL